MTVDRVSTERTTKLGCVVVVKVTASDIARGRKHDRFSCPVALALSRRFRTKFVSVEMRSAAVGGVMYRLPKRATNFIFGFDGGITPLFNVRPFSFRLKKMKKA